MKTDFGIVNRCLLIASVPFVVTADTIDTDIDVDTTISGDDIIPADKIQL